MVSDVCFWIFNEINFFYSLVPSSITDGGEPGRPTGGSGELHQDRRGFDGHRVYRHPEQHGGTGGSEEDGLTETAEAGAVVQ